MVIDKVLNFLAINTPVHIITTISQLNRVDLNTKTAIKIIVNSGKTIEGFPLKCGSEVSLLYNKQNNSISYVRNTNIISVEIPFDSKLIGVLTNDTYTEIPNSVPPSRLELNRKVKELSLRLSLAHNLKITTELLAPKLLVDKERHQFKKAIELVEQVLKQIGEDDLGKESLNTIDVIILSKTEEVILVKKALNQLEIGVNLNNKIDKDYGERLKEKIEMNL